MGGDTRDNASWYPSKGAEKRRARRHKTDTISCELGDVRDLSAIGMRVACRGKPPVRIGQGVPIRLQSEQQRIAVSGQVVWIRRDGFRSYQIGVKFIALKKSLSAALEALAMYGYVDYSTVHDTISAQPGNAGKSARRPKKPIRASAQLPNYYEVLGIPATATAAEIKAAFRRLAREHHPDVSSEPAAEERFIEINQAYEVLSDTDARQLYDVRRAG